MLFHPSRAAAVLQVSSPFGGTDGCQVKQHVSGLTQGGVQVTHWLSWQPSPYPHDCKSTKFHCLMQAAYPQETAAYQELASGEEVQRLQQAASQSVGRATTVVTTNTTDSAMSSDQATVT